jgi:ribonucleotide reductase beta subunit family protein with ferritin-like domain
LLYLHSYKDGLKPSKVKFNDFEPHYRKKIIVSGWKQEGEWESLTAKDRFLIALQADGSLDYRIKEYGKNTGLKKVRFSLKKDRKNQRLQEILDELGWKYTKTYNQKREDFNWYVWCPDLTISKTFNWVDLSKATSLWSEEFIKELMYWDGHDVNKDGQTIYYSSVESSNVDVIQALATFANIKCSRSLQQDNRKASFKDTHRVWLYLDSSYIPTGRTQKTITNYIGRVMCVSVPTGNIIVRQNNKVAIVGNCHVEGMNKLFHTFCEENPRVVNNELKKQIYTNFTRAVELEDALVDLIYENDENEICTLKGKDIKTYIRYLADRRLLQLGLKPIFEQKENPLEWLDWIVSGDSFKNFFEGVVTDYNASGMTGEWGWD